MDLSPLVTRVICLPGGELRYEKHPGRETLTLRIFCDRGHCGTCGCDMSHRIPLDPDLAARIGEFLCTPYPSSPAAPSSP
jgi:hypothetical protein